MVRYFVYGLFILMFVVGAVTLLRQSTKRAPMYSQRKYRLTAIRNKLLKNLSNAETDIIVREAGLKITGLTYQVFRYTICFVYAAALIFSWLYHGRDVFVNFIALFGAFVVTSPRRQIFGIKSPFSLFVAEVKKNKQFKYNVEIQRCLSQLKNLAISKANSTFSSFYIIEELSKYTVLTRPIFNRLLSFWYEARYEEAKTYFNDNIGTELGAALVDMFEHLDGVKPSDLISQISLYQANSKKELKTYMQKVSELKSTMLFLVASCTFLLILFDVVTIVYGIDTINGFKNFYVR